MNRVDVIKFCVEKFGYKSYLEIGCQHNYCFDQVHVPIKVGVDATSGGTHRMLSDDFFAVNEEKFDIIFIDGDHRHQQVFRDITNSLACLNESGVIIAHDCCPPSKADESTDNVRCGDAWKAFVSCRQVPTLDAAVGHFDFGVGAIKLKANTAPFTLNKHFSNLQWEDFEANKHAWLRLLDVDDFINWLYPY